jgi:hypothetical protein
MTVELQRPAPAEHGAVFTDHLVTATWTEARGWSRAETGPLNEFAMHPGMIGLHYGQVVFEGLKAHRQADGSMAVFRPRENASRFRRSPGDARGVRGDVPQRGGGYRRGRWAPDRR